MKELRIKLKALKLQLERLLEGPGRYYDPKRVLYLFENYSTYQAKLKKLYPSLFSDLPQAEIPTPSNTTDNEGRGYLTRDALEMLLNNVETSMTLISDAGGSMSALDKLAKDLSLIIEEAGNGLSISGAILNEYRVLLNSLENILGESLVDYIVTENYQDSDGSWGDGNLFRIKAKSLQNYIQRFLEPDSEDKARGASDIVLITSSIKMNLRRMFKDKPPQDEDVLQREIEKILNVLQLDLKKEQDQIAFSVSGRIPDFTVHELSLAIEAKLCNSVKRVKDIVEEINSDITAYKTKYNNLLFIIYDTGGFITDEPKFIGDFERNKGVMVIITKH